jgi:DNA-binding CsgD family transcriptional regulator
MTTSTATPSTRDAQAIDAVRRLSHAGLDSTTLLRRVARALHRAAPFELYSASTIDPASNLMTAAFAEPMNGGESELRPVNPVWFQQFYFEEGFEQTVGLLRRRQWATTIAEETGGKPDWSLCYRESMRPAGIDDKMHAVFVDRGLCWGDIELYQAVGSPAFTAEEVSLVRRIAPDVGAGLKIAALRAQADMDTLVDITPGVLVIDGQGRVTTTTATEHLLSSLADLDPDWRERGALPVPVQVLLGMLGRAMAPAGSNDRNLVPRLRVRARNGRWLSLHAAETEATPSRPAERIVVIAPAQPQDVAWLGMAAYDLSPREEEVVKLVVGGQTTRQISDRLFIAEHTVQRHLSNIFEKVGVRGRRALVKQVFVEQMLPNMN